MDLTDPTTLAAFMAQVQDEWDDNANMLGWVEQADPDGRRRALVGTVQDVEFQGQRLRVYQSVPHLGTFRGDLSLAGATFRAACMA